ncbi:hypothetical protein BC834DRAFT_843621 [Gloeopeniophorella convolvens]|nr:hypothetical protein BC834DRAFT_843621 [Gloeopeniophorella convolvens]
MSDSEGDFSDELLELAGATEKKRRRREGSSKSDAKRRKADVGMDTTSDAEGPESEEEELEENPYPLEGKYIDEADRQRILEMPEIQREELLAQRSEEVQRITDKRNLDQMFKAQKGGEGDSVAKAAKRQHAVRGATKEKSRKLDELKARRKAKDERKRSHGSPKRDRSSSPMEMETSEEEEDGQISKLEQEEEKELKLLSKATTGDEPLTLADLNKTRLPRNALVQYISAFWFNDFVKGAYVRVILSPDKYRVYEIVGVLPAQKQYKVNDTFDCKICLQVQCGSNSEVVPIDRVSNADFIESELGSFRAWLQEARVSMPTKRDLERKCAQMVKCTQQLVTERDINEMLKRKSEQQGNTGRPQANVARLERARLMQERTLALRRNDRSEVAVLDAKLAELAAESPLPPDEPVEDVSVLLAKVNERNRKANLEAIRKAELREAERKRKERRLGTPTSVDTNGRRRAVPRSLASRSATPNLGGSPAPGGSPGSLLPGLESPTKKGDIHARALASIEIDLGDF